MESTLNAIEQLVKVLTSSESKYIEYQKKVIVAICSMLYYKTMFYRNKFINKARDIVKNQQPRVLKRLCTLGQVKPVIEYEIDNEFYSINIPKRTLFRLKDGETKDLTEEEYQNFLFKLPIDQKILFEINSQCQKNPATKVIYNFTDQISQRLPDEIFDTKIIVGLKEKIPGSRYFAYSTKNLQDFIKASKNQKIIEKMNEFFVDFKRDDRKLKNILADLIYSMYPQAKDAEIAVQNFFNEIKLKEEKKDKIEKKEPEFGIESLKPSWEDINNEIYFYTSAVNERDEFLNISKQLENELRKMCVFSSLDSISYPSNDPDIFILDFSKIQLINKGIIERRDRIINSLNIFNQKIIGESRLDIKQKIVTQLQSFFNNWKTFTDSYLNICLLGPPGSGKTSTAEQLGNILSSVGILANGNFYMHSRASMVGQYIGETAKKVRDILIGSLESVIFIDEAYALAQSSGGEDNKFDPYGVEAINEIVGFLDKYKGKICVVAAGYECEMNKFWFDVNPGLKRRFPEIWILPDYSVKEFFNIVRKNVNTWKSDYKCITDDENDNCKNILQSWQTGKNLFYLIQQFYELFVNGAGDAEILADSILVKYFKNETPLNDKDILEILGNFLKDRVSIYQVNKISCNKTLNKDKSKQYAELFKHFFGYKSNYDY